MKLHRIIAVLIISLLMCGSLFAGSVLSSKGMGLNYYHPNARAMGMGGIGIALADAFTISRTNPAGLIAINTTRISLQYFGERNQYMDNAESAVSNYSNFDGFTFAIPYGNKIKISGGLSPFTRIDYNLSFANSLNDYTYTKSVQGQGGLNVFQLGFCFGIGSRIAVGVSTRYIFGKLTETWNILYDDPDFAQTKDEFVSKNRGFGFKTGILIRPFNALTLGATYTPEISLDYDTEIQYTFIEAEETSGSIRLPRSWGAGITYRAGNFALLGLEYGQKEWTSYELNGESAIGTKDTYWFSAGTEIQASQNPLDSYFKRIAFRFGFKQEPFFFMDPEMNTLTEQTFTVGLGLPLYMNVAQIDVAFSYGKRGNIHTNGISEEIYRLSVSLTGGEKWFIRRY